LGIGTYLGFVIRYLDFENRGLAPLFYLDGDAALKESVLHVRKRIAQGL
jgi:hypothetical protein